MAYTHLPEQKTEQVIESWLGTIADIVDLPVYLVHETADRAPVCVEVEIDECTPAIDGRRLLGNWRVTVVVRVRHHWDPRADLSDSATQHANAIGAIADAMFTGTLAADLDARAVAEGISAQVLAAYPGTRRRSVEERDLVTEMEMDIHVRPSRPA